MNKFKKIVFLSACLCPMIRGISQSGYWQQQTNYKIAIKVDVHTNRFSGTERLEYFNNSTDTLGKIFYHLYWNAYHPGSMMGQSGKASSINKLKSGEVGYERVKWIKLNGVLQRTVEQETILEIYLSKPILPHSKVFFELAFEAQIPLNTEGSGRDNSVGIRYSLPQWFPKICLYDRQGWHADPNVDVGDSYDLGNYDVTIEIDKSYIIAATGFLQNSNEIGYGYETKGVKLKRPVGDKLTWRFLAPAVYDFVWAADPQFRHLIRKIKNGPDVHVFYTQNLMEYEKYFKPKYPNVNNFNLWRDSAWNELLDAVEAVYPFIAKTFGPYAYKQYSFIQGESIGGLSFPMASLISSFSLEVDLHEFMHQWYGCMLAVNVSEDAWMAEGFTTCAAERVKNYYFNEVLKRRIAPGSQEDGGSLIDTCDQEKRPWQNGHIERYGGYLDLQGTQEEPLTTWSDYYEIFPGFTPAFTIGAYSKGLIFLEQLGYIVGAATRDRIIFEFYHLWKFKRSFPNDLIRVAEKVSGMQLGWYGMYWINTIQRIDYGIDSVWSVTGKTKIRLKKIGQMPMPIDLMIQYKNGSRQLAYIPAYLMFGEKPIEDESIPRIVFSPWKFTDNFYTLEIDEPLESIKQIEIDPTQRMADVDRKNNRVIFR